MIPTFDRVVVRVESQNEETVRESGIVLVNNRKRHFDTAEIVAVGPGRITITGERVRPSFEKGQRVLYARENGLYFRVKGETFLVLREEEIEAVLEPGE